MKKLSNKKIEGLAILIPISPSWKCLFVLYSFTFFGFLFIFQSLLYLRKRGSREGTMTTCTNTIKDCHGQANFSTEPPNTGNLVGHCYSYSYTSYFSYSDTCSQFSASTATTIILSAFSCGWYGAFGTPHASIWTTLPRSITHLLNYWKKHKSNSKNPRSNLRRLSELENG